MEGRTEVRRATAGFTLSLVAGILIIICSVFFLVAAAWMEWMKGWMYSWGVPPETPGIGPAQAIVTILGVIGLIFGIIVLIGAYFIYPWKGDAWRNIGASIFDSKHLCGRRFLYRANPWDSWRRLGASQKITSFPFLSIWKVLLQALTI